jgi:hypothetical protein
VFPSELPGNQRAELESGEGAVTGLVVDGTGFEVLAGGERVGSRRVIEPADVALLTGLAVRYVRAVQAGSDASLFVDLGQELFPGWTGTRGS